MKRLQFLSTNPDLISMDSVYWNTMLNKALIQYKNAADHESKSIACAELAGLGLAIHAHYSDGVSSLTSLEHRSSLEHGADTFERLRKHTADMERIATKALN